MRLRAPRAVGDEADVAGGNHATVRNDRKSGRRRVSSARAAAGAAPGAVDEVVLGRADRRLDERLAGRAFAAVTVAPALLAVAWLVPGTGLLLAGRLLALPLVIIFAPLAAGCCYFAMRRLPDRWLGVGAAARTAASGGGRGAGGPWGAVLLMVAIAAGFGVWQAFLRSEPLFTAGGPALYLQYGYWIAGHGTARVPEAAAAFGSAGLGGLGGAGALQFATTGYTAAGGSLTPAALPGVPLVLAGGAWLGGLGGALVMPAVLGGCAVLSFGGLVGRLCGAWQAVAAELVLALCLPEVYAARAPFGEPLVQVLLLGGLCLFIDALEVRSSAGDRGRALAGLGGVALGLTVLVSAASFGVLLPVIPVVMVLLVARHPAGLPFGLGLLGGAGTGVAAGKVLASSYLAGFSAAQGRLLDVCVGGFCVAAGLAVPLVHPGPRSRVRRVCLVNVRLPWFGGSPVVLPSLGGVAQWLALVLPAVVLVGLAERPFVRFLGGQLSGLRHYQQFGVYWAAWYLGVPALLLSGAAAAALGRRAVRAVLDGGAFASGAPGTPLRLWALPLLVVFWSSVTVLWDPFVAPWQPSASRRLVPVVLPGLVLLAVWALSWLASHAAALGASRRVVAAVAGCCVLAVAVPGAVTTLGPAVTRADPTGPGASGLDTAWVMRLDGPGASATDRGSVAAAEALCASIGSSASVLFTDKATAALYAPTVRGLCGEPAAVLTGEPAQAVRSVEQAGRRPVLLGPTRASVSLPGLSGSVARRVVSLRTAGDARTLAGAPTRTRTVRYALWLAVPLVAGAVQRNSGPALAAGNALFRGFR